MEWTPNSNSNSHSNTPVTPKVHTGLRHPTMDLMARYLAQQCAPMALVLSLALRRETLRDVGGAKRLCESVVANMMTTPG